LSKFDERRNWMHAWALVYLGSIKKDAQHVQCTKKLVEAVYDGKRA
jgi:hypothetical protein